MINQKVSLDSIPADAIVTYTGKIVRPLDPDPETIFIEDIAHSLANQCRFTGHTREFYSVAQHAVYVSQIVDWDNALAGLLHDASEAYIADIARPVKRQEGFGAVYREAEFLISRAIGDKFGVELAVLPDDVKWADEVLLRSEIRDLMEFEPYPGDYLDFTIRPLYPGYAESSFLDRYYNLCD